MLDVHPPHQATHSWRDFFIHIATICVGLLIAIGLEQTVEAIHRHHERRDLEQALTRESKQILSDTALVDSGEASAIAWIKDCESQISAAAREHKPLISLPPRPNTPWDVPDEPVYKAAKASGKLALLSDEDVVAYGELDALLQETSSSYAQLRKAIAAAISLRRELNFPQLAGADPFAHATPEDLRKLHAAFVDYEVASNEFLLWSHEARGATTAMVQGERDLHKIQTAERQFDKKP